MAPERGRVGAGLQPRMGIARPQITPSHLLGLSEKAFNFICGWTGKESASRNQRWSDLAETSEIIEYNSVFILPSGKRKAQRERQRMAQGRTADWQRPRLSSAPGKVAKQIYFTH